VHRPGLVVYLAFLILIYFFVLTDRGFGGGSFCKSVVKGQDDFYREKVTSEC